MARDLPARTVFNGPQTVANGRDARGRFVAGAQPGPGRPVAANPFARYQAELRGALLAEVRPADLRAVIRQVLRLAKRGHVPSVEILLKWVLGGPPPALDPDKLDAHEREVRANRLTMLDQLALAELPAEVDPDETPVAEGEAEDAEPLAPPLRTVLSWAIKELAQAQSALRAQRPPPPDPAVSWAAFAASRLEFDPQAAVDVDLLYVAYARWCAACGEPLLVEANVLAALQATGASLRTAPLSHCTTVVGVRVVA
jgi:hypothetical protein